MAKERSSTYSSLSIRCVGTTFYISNPYIVVQRGNLQDAINAHSINGTHFPEKEMVKLFKGTCEAIRAMHDYQAPVGSQSRQNAKAVSRPNVRRLSGEQQSNSLPQPEHHSDDEDDEGFPQAHGDGEGGYSYHNSGAIPLSNKLPSKKGRGAGGEEESRLMYGDPSDLEVHRSSPATAPGGSGDTELFPFAHRDMKPGNVMIADDGSPIVMDFGSAIPARIRVETRSQALLQQVHSFPCPVHANTEWIATRTLQLNIVQWRIAPQNYLMSRLE